MARNPVNRKLGMQLDRESACLPQWKSPGLDLQHCTKLDMALEGEGQ